MKTKLILFVLKILRIVITIITLSLTAKFFGVTIDRDNWIVAYSVFIVIDLAIWGPVNETFRAKFVELESKLGGVASLKSANSLFKFATIITVLLVVVLFFTADFLADFLLPSGNISEKQQLAYMIKLISPSLLINQSNLLMTSILNAFNVFYVPEIAGVVSSILNIVIMVLLQSYFGIYSLVFSHYCSLFILFFLLLYQFKSKKIELFKGNYNFSFSEVKPYILFALPFFFPYFFGQLGNLSEKYIANLIGIGTVSNIDYSRKFLDIPINVLTSLMTTLYVPLITKNYFNKQFSNVQAEFESYIKFGFIVIIAFTSVMVFCSEEVVEILFNKGNIDLQNLKTINNVLQLYAVASSGIFLYVIGGLTLISTNRSKLYAFYGVLAQLIIIFLNFIFYKTLGVYVFPLSMFVVHFAASIIMILKLDKLIQPFQSIFKTILILMCTLLFFYLTKTIFLVNLTTNYSSLFIKLGIYCIALSLIMFVFYKKEVKLLMLKIRR